MTTPTGRHRAQVRPRYGRMATLGSSVAVVVIAVLGGTGALPSSADDEPRAPRAADSVDTGSDETGSDETGSDKTGEAPTSTGPQQQEEEPKQERPPADDVPDDVPDDELVPVDPAAGALIDTALPGESGNAKRVVFSESRQRVWLVTDDEKVRRTYLVSGSIYDNLEPGTFEVYSRDKNAVGIDDSGTMSFFVRFTQGDTGAAIGFHDIPVDDGVPLQAIAQLGTPLSHGCIRQRREDAVALWKFAPLGTTVVVTA